MSNAMSAAPQKQPGKRSDPTMKTYENAPATKLLATACACCGRSLVDAVSVETGIGPDCRAKYSVDVVVDEAARIEANRLVFEVARGGISRKDAQPIFDRLAELGFTVLADRIAKRFRATVARGPSVEQLRAEYARLRADFCYDNVSAREVDALVKATGPSCPADFVLALQGVSCPCRRCAGTGHYVVGTENGSPKLGGGPCYRCEGRGRQYLADAYRNRAYDAYAMSRAARQMLAS